jgi:opacity protein-like surface antigen
MKRFLCVILLVAALATAASAGDFIVGATFGGNTTKLTTFEYRLAQPIKSAWGNELTLGVATGFDQLDQNTDVTKYSFGLGWNVTNGNATLAGGYTVNYVNAPGENNAYPGLYGSVDLKVSKSWFVQAKYTTLFGTDVAEGFQGSIGLRF